MTEARSPTIRHRDILGNDEVRKVCAYHLGRSRASVNRQMLARWRQTKGFPAPFKRLKSAELWDRKEVREWLRARLAAQDAADD